jgi:hypothetical protein
MRLALTRLVPSEEERGVNEKRIDGEENQGMTVRTRSTILASETLRNSGAHEVVGPSAPRGEEKMGIFWRVCGGTLLSIAALVLITVYQSFSSSLNDLRNEIIRINDSRAELIKKDEVSTRLTRVWSELKERIGERAAQVELQVKEGEQERKELHRELQQLRERLAALEGRQGSSSPRKASHSSGSDDP